VAIVTNGFRCPPETGAAEIMNAGRRITITKPPIKLGIRGPVESLLYNDFINLGAT